MKVKKCLACEGKDLTQVAINNYLNKIPILKCQNCGLFFNDIFINEDGLNQFYKHNYNIYSGKKFLNPLKIFIYFMFSRIFSRVKAISRSYFIDKHFSKIKNQKKKNKEVLEIGSGDGSLLYELKKNGWKVASIELSDTLSKYAKNKFKIKRVASTTNEYLKKSDYKKYDLVISFHVLEHLINPLEEIKNVNTILKENGYFIGGIPYVPKETEKIPKPFLQATAFNSLHLYHFNFESIKMMLEKGNFMIEKIERVYFPKTIAQKITSYVKANVHLLHPSFKMPFNIKFLAFCSGIELFFRYLFSKNLITHLTNSEKIPYLGPGDWMRFVAKKIKEK